MCTTGSKDASVCVVAVWEQILLSYECDITREDNT